MESCLFTWTIVLKENKMWPSAEYQNHWHQEREYHGPPVLLTLMRDNSIYMRDIIAKMGKGGGMFRSF